VNVYWDVLDQQGIKPDAPIGVPLSNVSIETALAIANERLGGGDKQIACRVTGDALEVSTLHHFDKREITLRAYDVGSVLTAFEPVRQPAEVAQELQTLVRGVIDPEQWRENGGDLAQMYMVGTKLFVTAPARFHPTVEWILGQLQSGSVGVAKPGAAAADVASQGEGVFYLAGDVTRPGTYSIPAGGVTLRQAVIASGTSFDYVGEVTITRTRQGKVELVRHLTGNELRDTAGQDPVLEAGQIVEVRTGRGGTTDGQVIPAR
jgi:hypothetical protein